MLRSISRGRQSLEGSDENRDKLPELFDDSFLAAFFLIGLGKGW